MFFNEKTDPEIEKIVERMDDNNGQKFTFAFLTIKRKFVKRDEEQLIFILSPEQKWGNYVIYPARVMDKGDFYLYLGRYNEEGKSSLSQEELCVLELCKRYEPSELYNIYGKGKYRTEQLFFNKIDEKILKSIRVFVDRTVNEIIHVIAKNDFSLFLRENRWDNPYKENRIYLEKDNLKPLLTFHRNEENIRYTLRLSLNNNIIKPFDSGLKIITEQPGLVLWRNRLYELSDGFSGTRIRPFLQKEEIVIPRESEGAYFRTFILKNICNEDIEVEGFDIIEPKVCKRMVLFLEQNLLGEPILSVKVKYNERVLSLSDNKPFIVELKEEEGQYHFYRLSRDFAWEHSVLDYLKTLGLCHTPEGYFILNGKMQWADILNWITVYQDKLKEYSIDFSQEQLEHPFYTGGYQLSYTRENTVSDWFQLKAEIALDNGYKLLLQDLWENILSGKREFLLKDGRFFLIPEEWFARYSGLLLFAKQGRKGTIMVRDTQVSLLEDMQSSAIEAESNDVLPQVLPPATLKAVLRDYQLKGFRWLYMLYQKRTGACLADDMGLGKTVQTISLLLKYKEETERREDLWNNTPQQLDLFASGENNQVKEKLALTPYYTCLIIAPASVEHNWKSELQKFAPSLTVSSYIGIHRFRKQSALMRWDVVTTTYHTMRNDIDFFSRQHFGIIVFDEAQMFKNRDSQLYQAIKALHAEHFVALSGTPIENSLSDMWSLMDVINHGLLGTHSSFQKFFIRPANSTLNELHLSILNKLIKPYLLRRTKEEVLKDLPERTDELVFCELTQEQKRIYEEELSKARNQILEQSLAQNAPQRAFNALRALVRLRQIANHPALSDTGYQESSGKYQEVFRMLETLKSNGHKVLLFSDYVTFLDLIAAEMDHRKWTYAKLVGMTRNRAQQIDYFNKEKDCQFFLISLKAGGVGINLTEADYVFILDPWWNKAAEEQAISRAHRMGQKQAVFVYRFVTSGTLEERILDIQRKKSQLSDAVITIGDEHMPLNTKELENLITDNSIGFE